MSRKVRGGRCICFGDDGVVVNAVSSLAATALRLVAILLFVWVETMSRLTFGYTPLVCDKSR